MSDPFLSKHTPASLPLEYVRAAKQMGFSDRLVAKATSSTELAIRKIRTDNNITPFVKQIDTGKIQITKTPPLTNLKLLRNTHVSQIIFT